MNTPYFTSDSASSLTPRDLRARTTGYKIFQLLVMLAIAVLGGMTARGQSFLGLDGGFEGTATIDNANVRTAAQPNSWTKNNATQTLTPESSTVRSGANSLKLSNGSTGRRTWTPLITTNITSNITVQYYRRVTNTTNTQESQGLVGNGTTGGDNSAGSYSTPSSPNIWEKVTYTRSSASYTQLAGGLLHRSKGSGGDMFIDDYAIYAGSVDTTAPNAPASPSVAQSGGSSPVSLDVSWAAASGGVDNGGYLVVRGTTDPTVTPNVNGIYAVGNTIGNGVVVYSGAATNFTDAGLTPATEYFYRVYTFDKAYNYSAAAFANGSTAVITSPTMFGAATAAAFTTTYGTPSVSQVFPVSGSSLIGNMTATAPPGFEVSSNGIDYGPTAVFVQSEGSASGSLHIRLKADAAVSGSPYNAVSITLTSADAPTVNITTSASGNVVGPKVLTITGLSAVGKNYDGTAAASVTGTPEFVGLVNGESFSVTGTVTWAFDSENAGVGKSVTAIGSYDAPSGNYTVSSPTLTADIASLPVTITGGSVVSRPYNGSTAAQITGAEAIGVLIGDSVTVVGVGTFASADIGTGISVSASFSLSGLDSGNYFISSQPTTFTGDITIGTQTITFAALPPKLPTDPAFALTATASSGLPITYTSSDPMVATILGSTVTIVGPGTTLITASQAGDSNYGPAVSVSQNQIVLPAPSVLAPGDIAVIALQSDTPDKFAFLALVDLNPGTRVVFTDNAWTGSALTTNEGSIVWQAPVEGVARGTVVSWIAGTGFSIGTVESSSGNFALATGGDQILAYQVESENITFVYGLSSSPWRTSGSTTNGTSFLPPGLVNGVSARDSASPVDNFYYTTLSITGTRAELLAGIGNIANWSGSADPLSSLPSWSFTVTTGSSPDPLFTDPTMNAVLSDQPAGVKRLSFTGIPGRVYGIQRSGNLSGWTQIDTVTAPPGGAVTFDDPSPLSGKGFYRIIFPAE